MQFQKCPVDEASGEISTIKTPCSILKDRDKNKAKRREYHEDKIN